MPPVPSRPAQLEGRPPLTRVEDLESRLVGQETVHQTYSLDWACTHCKRCGGLPVRASGRARDELGRPATHEPEEETWRRLTFMHRYALPDGTASTEPLCKADTGQVLIGLAWRWVTRDGEQVQSFLPKRCKGCLGEGRLPRNERRNGQKVTTWSMCLTCKGTGGVLPDDYSWPPWKT